MSNFQEVQEKYCNKCSHKQYCYRPCPLVLSALFDLPCTKEIENICKNANTEVKKKYTGRSVCGVITYILSERQYCKKGFVILGIPHYTRVKGGAI